MKNCSFENALKEVCSLFEKGYSFNETIIEIVGKGNRLSEKEIEDLKAASKEQFKQYNQLREQKFPG